MKKTLPTTPDIRQRNQLVSVLQDHLEQVLNQPFWHHKVQIKEKVAFLEALANAKHLLWLDVEGTYPEVKGKPYSVNNLYITYEATDEQGELPNKPKEGVWT